MRVLVAEDDELIRDGLVAILRDEGYQTVAAATGREAIERFVAERPDFVCLDIMMPGLSGYDVCREIRGRSSTVPIIFISAKSQEIDKVIGLELGADDFIVKPFGVREVTARIRAVTRRCLMARHDEPATASFAIADIVVAPAELRARRGDDVIDLSVRDVKILELFARHRGEVLARDTILDHAWGRDFTPNSRVLDQHIAQLRKRIERDPKRPAIIKTVHGVGYRAG